MNIVLYEPEIPGNTGNIGRSCLGNQLTLHLVGRLGFSLDDKYLLRSGLDYWKDVDLKLHPTWDAFLKTVPDQNLLCFFEKDGHVSFWDAEFHPDAYLVFGSETRGFPQKIIEQYAAQFYQIPMSGQIRSLNLSNAVAVAMYEVLRQTQRRKRS